MMTREEFVNQLETHGYIEDEYGQFIHPNLFDSQSFIVYSDYFTRAVKLNGADGEVDILEYEKHSFDHGLELIEFISKDWTINYFGGCADILDELLGVIELFRSNPNNIDEYHIAKYRLLVSKLKNAIDYSEDCVEEGKFNV